MEEKAGAVFTWDPMSRSWIKERGADDEVAPPAPPIDDGAVQTYFFDPADTWWHTTILGPKARQIAAALKNEYRSPYAPGLAAVQPSRNQRLEVWQDKGGPGKSRAPLIVGGLALVLFIGAGAFAAQGFFAVPRDADGAAAFPEASSSPVGAGASAPVIVSPPASAASTPAASPALVTTAPTSAPRTSAPRTSAPTAAAPTATTVTLTVRTSDGTQISYRGPNMLAQNTLVYVDFYVTTGAGQRGTQTLIVYLGQIGTAHPMSALPDATGHYSVALNTALPQGAQRISVAYGNDPNLYVLGSVTIP